ncbi:MAG: peptidylprolyl isomerase, partial [Actinomycetota bacterium]
GLTSDELDRLARNQLLFQKVRDAITSKVAPPEKQVVDFYNANKATFDGKIKISHILICNDLDLEQFLCNAGPQDQALAGQVATRAKNGEDFASLAKEFSKDRQTATRGGELGFVGKGELAKAFEDAAFALANPGDISDPVKTQFGYHVIRLLGRGEPITSARENIQEVLSQELRREELNKWIAGVVSKATVKVNPKFGRFDPSSLSVVPLKIQIPDRPAQNRSPAP